VSYPFYSGRRNNLKDIRWLITLGRIIDDKIKDSLNIYKDILELEGELDLSLTGNYFWLRKIYKAYLIGLEDAKKLKNELKVKEK